jgi:glycosyl-4,4'-diaponeurosporenoate acyltransferase
MPIELPVVWIVVLNCVGWPLIQLGLAWAFTRMPEAWFRHAPRAFPGELWMLRNVFQVKRWKDRLPDAAGWFGGGFAKRSLQSREPGYLRRFVAETWRGELCHWCAIAFVPVFFLWNPPWADAVILAYALAANLPCILAQRYNRIRLRGLLAGRRSAGISVAIGGGGC